MKADGLSKKANQFQTSNIKLPIALGEGGPVIRIVERDNRLRIMIEITEDTTNQQVRDIAQYALEWQRQLLDFQGAWRMGGVNEFMERLLYENKHGKSYNKLAKSINESVENHLREYLVYRKEVDTLYSESIEDHEHDMYYCLFWLNMKPNPFALSHAKDLLEAIGIKQPKIDNYLLDGLRQIATGNPPFLPGEPVTRFKLTETLRTYRKGRIHLSIQAAEQRAIEEDEV